jgi:hypothetical protein
MGQQVEAAPDQQISLTDPDARSMATSGKGTGIVGYNVQMAVEAEHHLIVAHEVTNVGNDRTQLLAMGRQAQDVMACEEVTALADRGYFNGDEVLACEGTGVLPYVPKIQTSGNTRRGLFTGQDFVYDAEHDRYTFPRSGSAAGGRDRHRPEPESRAGHNHQSALPRLHRPSQACGRWRSRRDLGLVPPVRAGHLGRACRLRR